MESYTNNKLNKKLQRKGIILDKKKKHCFDKYSYYQVINAYKNIFCMGIETIDDIENNIMNSLDIDRYKENYGIKEYYGTKHLYRQVLISICTKYGISYKHTDSDDELKEKIGIKKTIREYGIEEQDFLATLDEMSEKAFDDQCTGANPRYPLISEIKDIYLKVYYGN